ncbi:MAG: glycosyltransferase family 2 protein [bacterium]|nr:glycosyltransferase family 2 protein [bacterium]
MTDISIIILNYNTKDLLAQTLDSVRDRSSSTLHIETIVADNGSTDGSLELLKADYPWVKIVANGENLGFSAGNNKGVAFTTGRYVLFLNSDVQIIDSAISFVYTEMEKNQGVGIGTCYVELASGGIDPACHRGFPSPWRAFCYYTGLEKLSSGTALQTWFGGYHLLGLDLARPHEIDACIGAFMMVRRSVGNLVGWWDESFFMYGEDLDFCYRVKEKGHRIMFYPDAKILHFKHQSGLKKNKEATSMDVKVIRAKTTIAFYDAMKIFYHKHYMTIYPFWLTSLVLWIVELKKKRALQKIE